MNNKSVLLILGVIVLALVLFVVLRPEDEEVIDPPVVDEPEIIVHSLAVNGMTGPQIFLTLEDESIITAVIENAGPEEAEVMMSVRMDGELFDHRHDWTYVLQPGETKEVEEIREVHHTWYAGAFTVEVGDEIIEVFVEEERD